MTASCAITGLSSNFCHRNGLNQLNITNDDGFCALFVVNTPAVDDSGVGHGVEHLVFRRSLAFSQPETLFQLTSLTDLKINASTLSDVSYFHCQSRCLQSFLLGLRYLLNGLLNPVFSGDDLANEIHDGGNCGVIFRELNHLQQDGDHLRQAQADASDLSPARCHQYGGDSAMLSQLTTADLVNFHAQHYQASDISLVTANVESAQIAVIVEQLMSPEPLPIEPVNYCAKSPIMWQQFEPQQHLARWWLSARYFDYFSQHHLQLGALLQFIGAELLAPQYNLNQYQQFALNIIVTNQNSAGAAQILNQFISDNPRQHSAAEFEHSHQHQHHNLKKYSPAINRLLDAYYDNDRAGVAGERAPQDAGQLKAPLDGPGRHPLRVVNNKNDRSGQEPRLRPVTHGLITQLTELSAVLSRANHGDVGADLLPDKVNQQAEAVPKFLSSLYQAATDRLTDRLTEAPGVDTATASDLSHCLVVAKISSSQRALAAISGFIIGAYPPFLAPRTQGHCYVMAAQYLANAHHLVLYSALDVRPMNRLNAISHYLLLLSQDLVFIRATLTLAKIKFCNYYHPDRIDSAGLSPACLASFLKQLSDEIIITINRRGNSYDDNKNNNSANEIIRSTTSRSGII